MTDWLTFLEAFHFLRPAWWLAVIPAAWLWWRLMQRADDAARWKQLISPALLKHLVVKPEDSNEEKKIRPEWLLAALWLACIFALSGPSWRQEDSPFAQDQAALYLVVKVTPSMLAQDIQPSRLQRAAQKISDLLDLRPGTRTGLIAYAGSAHLVMPLTDDPDIIRYFADELDPDIMPVQGDDPVTAVGLAKQRLEQDGANGAVLLLADSIPPESLEGLQQLRQEGGAEIHIMALAAGPEVIPPSDSPPAPALDQSAMERAARAAGGELILVTPDDSDVRRANGAVVSSLTNVPGDQGQRWRDSGWFFVPLLVLLLLPLFRAGGSLRVSQ